MKYYELLTPEMQATLKSAGYTAPTPIQEQTLEHILAKQDLLGIAQTGTGKTAAFAVPLLEKTFSDNRKIQTLVLCPTRELVLQTTEVFRKLSANLKIRIVSVYGGQPAGIQIRALRAGAQIVVGTPGRVKDLINRDVLKLKNVRSVVLDEADEMLNFGFLPEIKSILANVIGEHQTLLFAATMNKDVLGVAQQFQNDPVRVEVGPCNEPIETVKQSYMTASEKQKSGAVKSLISQENPRLALVFCNTRRRVKNLQKCLVEQGMPVSCLHGDMSQSQRDAIMNTFRKGQTTVLVATDVAARGIDVNNIDLVINYDIPDKMESYIHRIGRTGRAGRAGRACTLVCPQDRQKIMAIERRFRIKLTKEQDIFC
ncbi:MAG: DEAD/DEAH box helicase [Christensenellaceae bacterium]|nr:DEAD/DEAH box helicase [Christensenellaceae bacterium]